MIGDNQELGESQRLSQAQHLHSKTNPKETHEVIEMYEEHDWGWPGKESPEMQAIQKAQVDKANAKIVHDVKAHAAEGDPKAEAMAKALSIKVNAPKKPAVESSAA